jgi:hypothetical protein
MLRWLLGYSKGTVLPYPLLSGYSPSVCPLHSFASPVRAAVRAFGHGTIPPPAGSPPNRAGGGPYSPLLPPLLSLAAARLSSERSGPSSSRARARGFPTGQSSHLPLPSGVFPTFAPVRAGGGVSADGEAFHPLRTRRWRLFFARSRRIKPDAD